MDLNRINVLKIVVHEAIARKVNSSVSNSLMAAACAAAAAAEPAVDMFSNYNLRATVVENRQDRHKNLGKATKRALEDERMKDDGARDYGQISKAVCLMSSIRVLVCPQQLALFFYPSNRHTNATTAILPCQLRYAQSGNVNCTGPKPLWGRSHGEAIQHHVQNDPIIETCYTCNPLTL